ncbi:MAG: hypothetical protein ABI910_03250 [Gemmatimonadota bacterium]
MESAPVSHDAALAVLEQVLGSPAFRGAERASLLLRFLVVRVLDGRADGLKEYTVGVEALGKAPGFDPRTDPIVRAEASRLRARLERYYASPEGSDSAVVLTLPRGSYVPTFYARNGGRADTHVPAAVSAERLPNSTKPIRGPILRWGVGASLIAPAVVAGGLWVGRRPFAAERALVQFDVELQAGASLGSVVGTDVVISRDGTRIAWVSTGRDGTARLSTRQLSEDLPTELPGTEGVRGPFFSPDGRWLGFWAARKLKKIPVEGGSPTVLCDATDLLGASWAEDGSIVATLNSTSTLWRVPAGGGEPRALGDFPAGGPSPAWAQILPGETHILYTAARPFDADRANIEVLSLRDKSRRVLVRGGTFGRYLASGFLSYINQGTLYVAPFDLARMDTVGPARPVLSDISYSSTFGYAQIDISRTGTVVYRKSAGAGRVVAVRLDSTGASEPLLDAAGQYTSPAVSPDGRRFALSVVEAGTPSVAFFDLAGGRAIRLLNSAVSRSGALWTRDSRFVVMSSGSSGISWARADSGLPHPLLSGGGVQLPWSFMPNGDRLAYHELSAARSFDLWTVPITEAEGGLRAGTPTLLLGTGAVEVFPAFSTDGQWVAYGSDASGSQEIYVRPFPDDQPGVKVSTGGGRTPKWSPNGRELFYGTDDRRLMVVRYRTTGGRFVPDTPRLFSPVRLADTGVLPNYDIGTETGRVVALVPETSSASPRPENHVTVMLNFFDLLRTADLRARLTSTLRANSPATLKRVALSF